MNSKTHLGHTAKKRFGQNFLIDTNIINAIVSAINPQKTDNLIEIGPGLGAITEPVGELVDKLTVIELDKELATRLEHHAFLHQKLNVIQDDVLKVPFKDLPGIEFPIKVFGNLPYNISTPLILKLILSEISLISEMTFMLQLEVVERFIATVGSKNYGRLSLIVQYFCDVLPVIDVPPESFKPAPKVNSAVVKLIPKKSIPKPVANIKAFESITGLAFGQRRKTIRNSLSTLIHDQDWEQLAQFGITPGMRAEEINLDQFIELTNYCVEHDLLARLNTQGQ